MQVSIRPRSMISGLLFLAIACNFWVSPYQNGMASPHAQTPSGKKGSSAYIPSQLRPSLDDGIRRFTQAQATEQWEEVARLLGRFRNGSRRHPYTQSHKECLLSQMRAKPMISFVIERIMFSTEILGMPAGKRWWWLTGAAEFRTISGITGAQTTITAYRDSGEWRFTPPNYDDDWVRQRVTDADLTADRSANVEIQLDSNCPLQIRDLSVVMHPEYLSLRRLRFKVVNKRNKKVIGYSLRLDLLGDPYSGISEGASIEIEPQATTKKDKEITYSAYSYYCEGESHRRLVIDSVSFADGSTWTDPRFRRNRRPKN